jgi:branched-chain amino acid transport system permease protein
VPLFDLPNTAINFLVTTLIITLAAQGWNILAGYAGQFSFGHAVFFGTAAYAAAVLQTRYGINAWIAFAGATMLAAAIGFGMGAMVFRAGLTGSYFALVTLAFAEVFRILANTFQFTGAGVGIQLPLHDSAADMQFADKAGFLHAALVLVTVSLLLAWWLKRSRYGAWLQAVRDNEESAAALGVNAFRVKLAAIMVSGALMAAGGVFYVQFLHYIDPHIAYGPGVSVEALLGPIVGGMGTLWGPVLGAVVLHVLGEGTRGFMGDAPGVNLVVYGSVLILMVMFLPRGIIGLFQARRTSKARAAHA